MEILFPLLVSLFIGCAGALMPRQPLRRQQHELLPQLVVPVGYRHDRPPITQIVDLAPVGTAVTADRMHGGYATAAGQATSMAMDASVLAFVFPVAAMSAGSIARGPVSAGRRNWQRTGSRGPDGQVLLNTSGRLRDLSFGLLQLDRVPWLWKSTGRVEA